MRGFGHNRDTKYYGHLDHQVAVVFGSGFEKRFSSEKGSVLISVT